VYDLVRCVEKVLDLELQVVPSLCGDAAMTNAMELKDFLKPAPSLQQV
jgi:hypothetical protein